MRRVGLLGLCLGMACLAGAGCERGGGAPPAPPPAPENPGAFAWANLPWVSFYGSASDMGPLDAVANAFRLINVDADPDQGNFEPEQLSTLRNGGKNRVISYLDIGSCETFRTYWDRAPAGLVPCGANVTAQLGPYAGYNDEVWMNPADPEYQRLILEHVSARLAAQGVDGFFLDNLEVVEHPDCDAACRQGGLELVRKLRERYPDKLIIMQNATSDVTRLGTTGGVPFPSLLDGISHEEVYAPSYSARAEQELMAWQALGPSRGHPLWIATEDYVGSCDNSNAAAEVYRQSRQRGFSPYATDASAGQQRVCFWRF